VTALDLLLVNPGPAEEAYQGLRQQAAAIEPPIWAGLIATFIRRRGYSVRVLDAHALGLTPSQVADVVAAEPTRLVALVAYGHHPSASTQVMPAAGAIATAIRSRLPEQVTCLLGGHVAALPERTLREEAVTFVAGGEGAHTIAAWLEADATAVPAPERIPDFYYRDEDHIRRSPVVAPLMALDDDMPGVAWDLLPMARYRAHNWHGFGRPSRTPYAAMYTTLGCPYTCTFCCIQAPFLTASPQRSYRRWSQASIRAEVRLLTERYGIEHLKIADELFVLHPGHVEAVCEVLTDVGGHINTWAYARVDTIRPGQLDRLRRAGVTWLALGIEAASAEVRADVDKACTDETITAAIADARAAGVSIIGNYIFGLPHDTRETMQQTLDLAIALDTEFANFYCTMAYPGSPLYDQALREGLPLPSSWSGYAQLGPDAHPLPTATLSPADVLAFRDRAFTSWFSRPGYVERLEAQFGVNARREVEATLAVPLRRRLLERR
jgi:radical SAM superfamily enzyme YgiQ (UPF0313 family)